MNDVDLVVNVWERTYRRVMAPGLLTGIEEQNQREGESYPNLSLREKIQKRINRVVLRLFDHLPTTNPRFKINSADKIMGSK